MKGYKVPRSHPRYRSLMVREQIVSGVEKGITSPHGLLAHGRGEAFNYLIGERTNKFAKEAIDAACAHLLLAKNPILSVNGNAAALVAKELVELSKIIPAKLEVNIFHGSKVRERRIYSALKSAGASEILLPSKKFALKTIGHNRRYVNKEGIWSADLVFVPLEDGDRCKALIKEGKKVVVIDLNPISRTSLAATVTIVDDIIRAMPLMIKRITQLKKLGPEKLKQIVKRYDNKAQIRRAIKLIRGGFGKKI